ncbi:MAG: hypothetical protein HZB14_09505 [Actinobacteria bacterium]|nr:hypothetical protein [Actinomycetota bacterium]
MRFKLITVLAAIAALAVGVTASNAGLRSETSVKIKIPKAKAPAQVQMTIDNTHTLNGVGVVPERVNQVVIKSAAAKWYSKGAPQCNIPIPSAAAGNNTGGPANPGCPAKSKIGTGKFEAHDGIVGQPYDPSDAGRVTGTLTIYNYKPSGGAQAALLLEAKSDIPVPNVYQYILATVKGGSITASVPNAADLPASLANLMRNPDMSYRTLSMANMTTTIKAPKVKKGKALFTLNQFKSMDFSIVLNRD